MEVIQKFTDESLNEKKVELVPGIITWETLINHLHNISEQPPAVNCRHSNERKVHKIAVKNKNPLLKKKRD